MAQGSTALESDAPPFPAYAGDGPYVFVSYSHSNREEVYGELVHLREAGINVWYDEGITPGSEWTQELADAIRKCSRFVFYVSPGAVTSRNCLDEVQLALKAQRSFVVVYLEATALPHSLGKELGAQQAVYKHRLDPEEYRRELIKMLRSRARLPNTRESRRRASRISLALITLLVIASLVYVVMPSSAPSVTAYRLITKSQDRFSPYISPYPIVTDGPRVYFVEWDNMNLDLRQVSINGGESTALGGPFTREWTPFIAGITPDRAELIIATERPNVGLERWLWSPSGGEPRPLGTGAGAHDMTWSNDGSLRVFGWGEINVAGGDGSEPREIVKAPGLVGWIKVSPDNSRIRFTARNETSGTFSTLWEVSIDGSDLHPLLPGWNEAPNECCGSWTPDGKYYVFQANHGGHWALWVLPEAKFLPGASTEPIRLTADTIDFVWPTITPDGRKIVAMGWKLGGEVMRYDIAAKQWTPYFANRSAEWLSYSKDGQWVAYASYPSADLWRSRSDGSEAIKLTTSPMQVVASAWSPDARTIAFEARLPGSKFLKLYLVSADGASPPEMLTPLDREEWFPTWSPEGASLAFSTEEGVRLFDTRTRTESELVGAEGLRFPSWSPNGRYLVAIGKDARIMLFDSMLHSWKELQRVPNSWYPTWSAEGRHVHLVSFNGEVKRLSVEDGRVELTASLGSLPWAWGTAGMWLGVSPDGSPVYLRDTGVYHVYAIDWET